MNQGTERIEAGQLVEMKHNSTHAFYRLVDRPRPWAALGGRRRLFSLRKKMLKGGLCARTNART